MGKAIFNFQKEFEGIILNAIKMCRIKYFDINFNRVKPEPGTNVPFDINERRPIEGTPPKILSHIEDVSMISDNNTKYGVAKLVIHFDDEQNIESYDIVYHAIRDGNVIKHLAWLGIPVKNGYPETWYFESEKALYCHAALHEIGHIICKQRYFSQANKGTKRECEKYINSWVLDTFVPGWRIRYEETGELVFPEVDELIF